jgi:hypothetical protein
MGWLISDALTLKPANIHTKKYPGVTHLEYIEVSTTCIIRPQRQLRTLRYMTVMRDQRCLCPEYNWLSNGPFDQMCDSAHPNQLKL